jgi:hypothetical protein
MTLGFLGKGSVTLRQLPCGMWSGPARFPDVRARELL